METSNQPTLGLALSGSGNRTTFYIGFLEVLDEHGIKIDSISACSGGSLVAAAYACGSLKEFKEFILGLDSQSVKQFFAKSTGRGGLYSLDVVEEEMRRFTKGKTFEEVRPLMSFVTVDIESGQQLNLCMGDIAKAARISCTLPGIFEPVKWGNKTLVDGGLLSLVPMDTLKTFSPDISIGVNMRGTKHIFSEGQMTLKKIYNVVKKLLFVEEMESLISGLLPSKEEDVEVNPRIFTVIGKSLDIALAANEKNLQVTDIACDLMITPAIPLLERSIYADFRPFYEMGRECALEYVPKIKELIMLKEKKIEKVA